MKILVAEDDEMLAEAVRRILTRAGCEVVIAPNGQDAVEKLRTAAFDGVICDMEMPRLDGAGVFAAIKAEFPELLSRFAFHTSMYGKAVALHPVVLTKADRHEILAFIEKLRAV